MPTKDPIEAATNQLHTSRVSNGKPNVTSEQQELVGQFLTVLYMYFAVLGLKLSSNPFCMSLTR